VPAPRNGDHRRDGHRIAEEGWRRVAITVVLDTSAVPAYTKGSIAVGELLSIITNDGDTALVPATCLAE
jgi:hypothetical protein